MDTQTNQEDFDYDEFKDAIGDEEFEMGSPETMSKTLLDPKERTQLPWFKDPNIKLGIWAILKDNLGKDMTKITLPVFFNDPLNIMQKSI